MTLEQIQSMLFALASNAGSLLVYIAIVVLFLIGIAKCIVPMLRVKHLLNSANRAIRSGNSRRSWQEESFLGTGAMYSHWKEYLNNLFFADGEFHNPSNIEDFINEETAIYAPGRSALAEALPGLMVSLGFLGTLIGITMGLQGFDLSNAEAVMKAIRTLIPGMQYAFMTSIVGVIGSVVFTIINRSVSGSSLHALTNFYAAMREFAGVVSVDPMTQIAIYQQEQTAMIQNLVTNLDNAFITKLSGAIERVVKPMQKSLDEFVSVTTREQLRGIDTMVTRFITQLDQSMENQFQHLAYTIDTTCRNQQQMQADIQRAVEGLSVLARDVVQVQKISEGTLSQFESYMSKLNSSIRLVDEAYARIASNVEHLEIIASQQNAYLQSVGQLQTESNKTMENFRAGSEEFMTRFHENIDVATGSLAKVCEELRRAADVLGNSQKLLVNGINKDIDQTYNTFFGRVNESAEQLGWMIDDIKNNIAKLPDLLDSAAGLYASQGDRMTDALRRAQMSLDAAAEKIADSSGYGR